MVSRTALTRWLVVAATALAGCSSADSLTGGPSDDGGLAAADGPLHQVDGEVGGDAGGGATRDAADGSARAFAPIRITCGHTTAVTDATGHVWSPDEDFTGGSTSLSAGQSVTGTDTAALYDGQRYGSNATAFSYAIPVPPGQYQVLLKFTENFATAQGQRLFDVAIDEHTVLDAFDIFAASGDQPWVAVDRTFAVTVGSAGVITLEFQPGTAGNPKVDAIEVSAAAAPSTQDAGSDAQEAGPAPTPFGIRAEGSKLVSTQTGATVELIGANLSGLENSQSPAMWTPYANTTLAFWQSLNNYQGSGINVVRLQLNSAFWLGYACGYSAATYQATVEHVVSMATQAGLYVIVDLHWDMPKIGGAGVCPTGQSGLPSFDYAPAFWKSLADTFKGNPAVIFELFNEPFGNDGCPSACGSDTEWDSWSMSPPAPGPSLTYLRSGGSYTPLVYQNNQGGNVTMITNSETYPVAGEISLLQTIRGEGATNLVLASTGGWDGAVDQWLNIYNTTGNPDPLKNFGATWHDYPGWTGGSSFALAIVAAGYPLVITETYGFDANLNAVGNFTTGGAGISETAGYAFARANNIGYVCGAQVNDWAPGQTVLSLTMTPPWAGCASQ